MIRNSSNSHLVILGLEEGGRRLNLREVISHYELLWFLSWRDLILRYKQTALGPLWAVLQPLLSVGVFSVLFGVIARIPSKGISYPLFTFCGMILWIYFANSAGRASFCLVGNAALLTKVYFPRLILPLSTIFPGLLDFFVAFLVLILGMFIKGNTPSFLGICLVPMIVGWTAVVTFGVGLWLGALNVRYRDVNNFFNFIMQLWMFATPVLYPESLVDVKYRYWLGLNPLVGIISSFRSSLFGTWDTDPILIAESLVMTLLIVLTGMSYFAKVEKTFADII